MPTIKAVGLHIKREALRYKGKHAAETVDTR